MPKAVDPGCRVKLLFMTQAGSVFAPAEMLRPVSWVLQPFRFLSLEEGDQRKVQATVHSFLGQSGAGDDWVDRYRAKLTNHKPSQKRFSKIAVVGLALATACFGGALYFCGVFVR